MARATPHDFGSGTTILRARRVRTVDPSRPVADAIAIRAGQVLAVGTVDELSAYGPSTIDDRFADHVLLPGMVEAHSHSFEGAFWLFPYVGYYDRTGPDGKVWSGCRSIEDVLDRLRGIEAAMTDPDEMLIAWGLDPIYFGGERLVASHLDRVSTTRPIFVLHASVHLASVNSELMRTSNIDRSTDVEGIPKDGEGNPIGELQEFAAMGHAWDAFGKIVEAMSSDEAIENFGRLARNAGVTTVTELGSTAVLEEATRRQWVKATSDGFPARVSMFYSSTFGGPTDPAEAAAAVAAIRGDSTDMVRFGHVKMILDGSIQGFTARLQPPGYLGDRPNGIWIVPPVQVEPALKAYLAEGLTVHVHCNGDEATQVLLDAADGALRANPWPDHRLTVQHSQMTTPAQYRRMAALRINANLFANHTFYWGDQHRDVTVGPDRAARMNAAATALSHGVQISLHSDAAVTPIGQLHTMWCAVNRRTASGEVLGESERISAEAALHAVTVGSAFQLRMDGEIGSIEPGKRADFAVVDDDPIDVAPEAIRDIGVWGTVVGGQVHEADGRE